MRMRMCGLLTLGGYDTFFCSPEDGKSAVARHRQQVLSVWGKGQLSHREGVRKEGFSNWQPCGGVPEPDACPLGRLGLHPTHHTGQLQMFYHCMLCEFTVFKVV
jgi:hypothetical protein